MARTLDPAAHALRRDEFIDAAQRLIQSRGYDQMSVQDVLDDLGASKGAFYHYFDSKADLLTAVVDQIIDGAIGVVAPMVADPGLTAPEKFQRVFGGIAQFKNARIELLQGVIQAWISDDNAIVREKFRQVAVRRLSPLMARIVEQGLAEGVYTAGPPGSVARVLLSLMLGANEAATELYVARRAGTITFETVQQMLAAYGEAFDRILGASSGSYPITDEATLRLWFD
ncbi:MAG: TetR/AcrR family transcriptional regulator [Chloroflexi bacterium]|nr:TetR/AcrR family transcriptional regulator [Chloroflexota bacterium]